MTSTRNTCRFLYARVGLMLCGLAISIGSRGFAQATTPLTDTAVQPFFAPATPAGFNPLTASDSELRTYGFPPRPLPGDKNYSRWQEAMGNV